MKTNENIVGKSIRNILSGNFKLCNNTQMNDIDMCKSILNDTVDLLKDEEISNFILTNDELFKLVNDMNYLLKELIKPNN